MLPHSLLAWFAWVVRVVSTLLALGGCFLVSRAPERPDPAQPVSGPAVSVERCQGCHGRVAEQYAQSFHTAKGIRCGQCHTPGDHPNFTQPVRDAKCGGCHQPAYQQTLASQHFAGRQLRSLDDDQAARAMLRGEDFVTTTAAGGRRFVGDSTSGDLGGRLCAACHYDEHRLGLAAVQRADSCVGCHTDVERHFPIPTPGLANRCTRCHVRAGTTDRGQPINTHRFARPGGERAER
jgi:hypothetical protein